MHWLFIYIVWMVYALLAMGILEAASDRTQNLRGAGKALTIGAIIGGVAGTVAAKKTKGKPVEVPAGTMLTLTLTQPLTVQVPI